MLIESLTGLAQSEFLTLRQSNGIEFLAREAGYCCYLNWFETPEGYMVVRGPDKDYYYAQFDNARGFKKSMLKVAIDSPQGSSIKNPEKVPEVWNKIQSEVKRFNDAAEENRKRFLKFQGKTDYDPLMKKEGIRASQAITATTLHIGVLLVEFSDLSHYTPAYSKSDFEDMLFADDGYDDESPDGEDVYGSLNDWYEVQSHSELSITGNVINAGSGSSLQWINLGPSSNYPGAYGGDAAPTALVVDAINTAIDLGWTVNQPGSFVIMVILAGGNNDLYR